MAKYRRHQGRRPGRHRPVRQQVLRERRRAAAYAITTSPVNTSSVLTLIPPVRTRWVDYAKHDYDAYVLTTPSPRSYPSPSIQLTNTPHPISKTTAPTSNRSGTPGSRTPSTHRPTRTPSARPPNVPGRPAPTCPTLPPRGAPTRHTARTSKCSLALQNMACGVPADDGVITGQSRRSNPGNRLLPRGKGGRHRS